MKKLNQNLFKSSSVENFDVACENWATPTPPWLCPLSDFSLIQVSGKDAFEFLNGQLSNDLKEISQNTSQFSSYCNSKGRLYCNFHIFMRDGSYYLRAPATISDSVINRLKMFVLRSDVTLSQNIFGQDSLGGIGLLGQDAEQLLRDAGLDVPTTVSEVKNYEKYSLIASPGICNRYEIYAPLEELQTLWDKLAKNTILAQSRLWRLYDIFSGIANIHPQTSELFVPQMVNFDLIEALSFSKGCYPGQEIVARTHYLGKLKRRMYRFVLPQSASDIEPGTAVFVPAYSAKQQSGEVVDACKLSTGTVHGLASLRIQGIEHGELRLNAPDGAVAHTQDLPYKITAETQTNVKNEQ